MYLVVACLVLSPFPLFYNEQKKYLYNIQFKIILHLNISGFLFACCTSFVLFHYHQNNTYTERERERKKHTMKKQTQAEETYS